MVSEVKSSSKIRDSRHATGSKPILHFQREMIYPPCPIWVTKYNPDVSNSLKPEELLFPHNCDDLLKCFGNWGLHP